MTLHIRNLEALITDFVSSLDQGPQLYMIHYPLLMEKLLEWHKEAWVKWIGAPSDGGTEWIQIYHPLEEGVRKIGRKSIEAKQYAFSVTFLKNFISHLEKNKDTKVERNNGKWFYRDYAYKVLFSLITKFVSSSEPGDLDYFWKQIPSDWKVTASNLREKKVFANLAAAEFIDWACNRIQRDQGDKYDESLDDISGNLFPEANSQTWEIILLFVCSPFDSEAQAKSVIERNWGIGMYSLRDVKMMTFAVGEEKETEEEKQRRINGIEHKIETSKAKAYELALIMFPNVFTKEALEKSITDAKKLHYQEDSKEDRKRKNLLLTLEGLNQSLLSSKQ